MAFNKKSGRRVQVISAHGQAWRDDDDYSDEDDFVPVQRKRKSTQSGRCTICQVVYATADDVKKHECISCYRKICSRCCTGVDPVCIECMGGKPARSPPFAPGKASSVRSAPAGFAPPSKPSNLRAPAPKIRPPSPIRAAVPAFPPKQSAPPVKKAPPRKSPAKKPRSPPSKSMFSFGSKKPKSPTKKLPPPAPKAVKSNKSSPPFAARGPPPSRASPPTMASTAPKMDGRVQALERELQQLMASTAGRNPTIGERDRIKELMQEIKGGEQKSKKPASSGPPAFSLPAKKSPAFALPQKKAPAFNKPPALKKPPTFRPQNKAPPKAPIKKSPNRKPIPKPAEKSFMSRIFPGSAEKTKAPPKPPPKKKKTFKLGVAQAEVMPDTKGMVANNPFIKANSGPKKAKSTKKPAKKKTWNKKPPPKPTAKSSGTTGGSVKDMIARRNQLDQQSRTSPFGGR